jgi:hypothetical protein
MVANLKQYDVRGSNPGVISIRYDQNESNGACLSARCLVVDGNVRTMKVQLPDDFTRGVVEIGSVIEGGRIVDVFEQEPFLDGRIEPFGYELQLMREIRSGNGYTGIAPLSRKGRKDLIAELGMKPEYEAPDHMAALIRKMGLDM